MLFISHRGNLNGPIPPAENTQPYILNAIYKGFFVEIDLAYDIDTKILYLDNDTNKQEVSLDFIKKYKDALICNTKNTHTAKYLLDNDIHCFTYDGADEFTITSHGWIWTSKIINGCVITMPEYNYITSLAQLPRDIFGVCSDYIQSFSKQ